MFSKSGVALQILILVFGLWHSAVEAGGSLGGGGGGDRPISLASGPEIVCGQYFCGVIVDPRSLYATDFQSAHDQLLVMRLKDEARRVGVCRMEFDNSLYAREVCPTNLKILETETGYACGCPRGTRSVPPRP